MSRHNIIIIIIMSSVVCINNNIPTIYWLIWRNQQNEYTETNMVSVECSWVSDKWHQRHKRMNKRTQNNTQEKILNHFFPTDSKKIHVSNFHWEKWIQNYWFMFCIRFQLWNCNMKNRHHHIPLVVHTAHAFQFLMRWRSTNSSCQTFKDIKCSIFTWKKRSFVLPFNS